MFINSLAIICILQLIPDLPARAAFKVLEPKSLCINKTEDLSF